MNSLIAKCAAAISVTIVIGVCWTILTAYNFEQGDQLAPTSSSSNSEVKNVDLADQVDNPFKSLQLSVSDAGSQSLTQSSKSQEPVVFSNYSVTTEDEVSGTQEPVASPSQGGTASQVFLVAEEFSNVKTSVIESIINLPMSVEDQESQNVVTLEDIGMPPFHLESNNLSKDDQVLAVNQFPIDSLTGRGETGSFLVGGPIDLQIKQGDQTINIVFDSYN